MTLLGTLHRNVLAVRKLYKGSRFRDLPPSYNTYLRLILRPHFLLYGTSTPL